MDKRIEQYLNGIMDGSEKEAFGLAMAEDEKLSNEVEEARFSLQAIRMEGRSQLKSRLRQLDAAPEHLETDKKNRWFHKGAYLFIGFTYIDFALLV
ncbi:MAG: hypothetical protein ACI8YQ_004370 [Polaribacter sp.]|jgi:hypothetical protein